MATATVVNGLSVQGIQGMVEMGNPGVNMGVTLEQGGVR